MRVQERRFLIPFLCLLFSGCSSLINPYRFAEKEAGESTRSPTNLAIALQYADAQMMIYRDAVADRASMRNGMPLFLVPLGAVLAYRAGTGGSDGTSKVILGGTLAGGTAYGVGAYFSNSPRERIYLAGIKALSCVKRRAYPYALSIDEGKRLSGDRIALVGDMQKLKLATGFETSERAKTSYAFAQSVLQRAITFDAHRRLAASALISDVERIISSVDTQIEKTAPDLQQVLKAVGRLSEFSNHFSGVTNQVAALSKDPATIGAQGGGGTLTEPNAEIASVKTAATTLDQWLAVLEQGVKDSATSTPCELEEFDGGLSVSPSTSEIGMVPGNLQRFVVTGGVGIPSARIVGLAGNTGAEPVKLTLLIQGNSLVVDAKYEKAVEGIAAVVVEFVDGSASPVRRQVKLVLGAGAQIETKKEGESTDVGDIGHSDSGPDTVDPPLITGTIENAS